MCSSVIIFSLPSSSSRVGGVAGREGNPSFGGVSFYFPYYCRFGTSRNWGLQGGAWRKRRVLGDRYRRRANTSPAVTINAFQSTLGRTFNSNCAFGSMVSDTNSQSLGWRGKEVVVDLQALTAQVRKLRVRTFIFVGGVWWQIWRWMRD